jgi:hypothetical protein
LLLADPRTTPVLEIGEIDIRGEILAAGVLIDRGAFEVLVEEISADCSAGPAVIEGFGSRAVVDGEHASGFPLRQPLCQITAVRIVNLDALAGRMAFEKSG